MIFGRDYLQFGIWHVLDEQLLKQAMCRAPKQFKPCRFAPRVKSETEQAYHKIYLVYARQEIKHANANLGMKRN